MNIRTHLTVASLAIAVALVIIPIAAASSPAHRTHVQAHVHAVSSSVGCWSYSCTGRDPIQAGCSADARTIDTVWGANWVRVELRYSPACNAAWAKAIGPYNASLRGAVQGFTTQTGAYPSFDYGTPSFSWSGNYSAMVSFTYWVRACFEYNAYGWSTQACTSRH